jgi:hypothetical protein
MAFYRATGIVCLHVVFVLRIGEEGVHQEDEELSHHHVAPGMPLPYKPSHHTCDVIYPLTNQSTKLLHVYTSHLGHNHR